MKKRRLSQNEEAIRGILLIVVFIVGLIFLRDILVKRGVSILMLTRQDYMNAVEYYMQQKYGEKFEGEYIVDDSIYVHPKANPYWHAVVEIENDGMMTYFHDNYVGYLKKAELEKYIYELVKPIYRECKVYIEPHGFALDDSWSKDTDMRIYASKGDYNVNIFTNNSIEYIDTEFKSICQIFIDNKLESNVILATYITDSDLKKFQEKYIDMINNKRSFFYRIDAVYDNVEKRFIDIDILKGREDYANQE